MCEQITAEDRKIANSILKEHGKDPDKLRWIYLFEDLSEGVLKILGAKIMELDGHPADPVHM